MQEKNTLIQVFQVFGILADLANKWQVTESLLPASFLVGHRKKSTRPFKGFRSYVPRFSES